MISMLSPGLAVNNDVPERVDNALSNPVKVLRLYISAGHNFFGHHGKPPGETQMTELPEIECVAGQGVRGDRFFAHQENYKGQITFFAWETYDALCQELQVQNKFLPVFRRNVITAGVDLNDLIGQDFSIQGVRFRGTEECRPCYWMDQAFAPGAFELLKGRGGLRAVIVSDGILRTNGL
jgi:MOSC domain-containing protein YiiM